MTEKERFEKFWADAELGFVSYLNLDWDLLAVPIKNLAWTTWLEAVGKNSRGVMDFGWANGWPQTPRAVSRCKKTCGQAKTTALDGRCNHEVRCDACAYVYKYNSS